MIRLETNILDKIKQRATTDRFKLPEINPGGDATMLTSERDGLYIHTSGYLQAAGGIESMESFRVHLPPVRLINAASASELDLDSEVNIPVSTLMAYKGVMTYLGSLIKLVNGAVKISENELADATQSILDDITSDNRDAILADYKALVKEVLGDSDSTENRFLGKAIMTSLKDFAVNFYVSMFVESSIAVFMNPTGDTDDVNRNFVQDLDTILSFVSTNVENVGAEDDSQLQFHSVLQGVSPETRALYAYLDKTKYRENADPSEYIHGMDDFRKLFPTMNKSMKVTKGDVKYPNTVLDSSVIVEMGSILEHDITFNDAVALTAGVVTGHPLSEETIDLIIDDKLGSVEIGNYSYKIEDPESVSHFMKTIRPALTVAVRSRLVTQGRELSNTILKEIPGWLPSDLPGVVYEKFGVNVKKLLNCAIIVYQTALEADRLIANIVGPTIEAYRDSSFQLKKLPSYRYETVPCMMKSYVDKIIKSPSAIFSISTNYFMSNMSLLADHRTKRAVDIQVKNLIMTAETIKLAQQASAPLTTKFDPFFHTEEHLYLDTFIEASDPVSGEEVWGTEAKPSLVYPMGMNHRAIRKTIIAEKKQEWIPGHYSVGAVMGQRAMWEGLCKSYNMNMKELPVVNFSRSAVGDIMDKQGRLTSSGVLLVNPIPETLIDDAYREMKYKYSESINFYPLEMVSELGFDFDLVDVITHHDTAQEKIASLLLGDFQDISLIALRRHPNARFFFTNLKSAKNIEDLNLKYTNYLPVRMPEITALRHSMIMVIPDMGMISMPFSIMSKDARMIKLAHSTEKSEDITLISVLNKINDSNGLTIQRTTSVKVYTGGVDKFSEFAREISDNMVREYKL